MAFHPLLSTDTSFVVRDISSQRLVTVPVLHVDAHYLAIDKPHDVPVDGEGKVTVESILIHFFASPRRIPKLYLVHQLDAVTSGVHLWALSSRVSVSLDEYCMLYFTTFYSPLVESFYVVDGTNFHVIYIYISV